MAEEEEAAVEEEKNRSWFKSLSYSGDLRKRIDLLVESHLRGLTVRAPACWGSHLVWQFSEKEGCGLETEGVSIVFGFFSLDSFSRKELRFTKVKGDLL